MTRRALGLAALLAGCSVPTPVGQLEPDLETTTGSQTSSGGPETSSSSGPAASSTSTSASTSTGDEGSTGSPVAPQMRAFAIRWGDIPEDDDSESGMSGVATGSTQDPDALLVVAGFTRDRCEEVYALDPCGTWRASFTLQVDQQVAGTYDGATVNASYGEQAGADATGECSGGGGTLEATVVVESIDDTGVQLRFEGVGLGPDQFDLDGFSAFAPRC